MSFKWRGISLAISSWEGKIKHGWVGFKFTSLPRFKVVFKRTQSVFCLSKMSQQMPEKDFFFLLTLFELERSRLSTENCWSPCLTCFCACVMKSTWHNFTSICKKSKSHNIAKVNRMWLGDVIHDMKSIREALYLLQTKKKTFWQNLLFSMKEFLLCFRNVIHIPTVIWAANHDLPKLEVVGGPQLWIIHTL